MISLLAVISRILNEKAFWKIDWVWGFPMILLTVIIHVLALGYINQNALWFYGKLKTKYQTAAFALVMGTTTLVATLLHALEIAVWAKAYRIVGALPDSRQAMLYSFGAMTTYGHQNIFLTPDWQLLGAIEALNGWLLFGLTTASLFWLIMEVSPRYHTAK
jgi:hypothetical protein